MAADGTIIIDTMVDATGIKTGGKIISRQIDNVGGHLSRQVSNISSMAKKAGAAIAAAFAVGKLAGFTQECLQLGSDLEEVQNVVDSTFTTMSEKVNEFARNAAMTAGLSETMAKRYTGTFGAMAKSFGFTEAQALEMSTALTQLSGDVASFYNLSQDEAYTKLKSVFTGETESLKELGVVMTQTALDEFALANGFGKTTKAMSEQEKVSLRYRFVLKQLDTAAGDFVRTSDSWANQTRILKLQIDSLKATIGQGFINLFTPAIKAINILLAKLATVANAFKAFTELITGKKSSGNTGNSQAGLADSTIPTLGDSYNTAANGADNLADSTKKVAEATNDAKKAAEGYLNPLDEINKYSRLQEAASDGIITPGGTAGGGLPDVIGNVDYGELAAGETVVDRMSDSLNRLAELIRAKDWEGLGKYMADGINNGLKKIYNVINWDNVGPKVIPFIDAFTRTFNSLVDNIDWHLLGKDIGAGINTLVNILNRLITGIDWKNLGKKFAEGISGIVDEVDWGNLGELIGNKFMIGWDIFNGFVHNLPYADIGRAFAEYLNGVFRTISFGEIGESLATAMNGAFTSLYEFAVTFDWSQMVLNIANGINRFFSTFDWIGNGQKLEVFINKMLEAMLEFARETDWEQVAVDICSFLEQIDWEKHMKQLFEILKTVLGGIWKGLGETSVGKFIQAIILFKIGARLMPFVNSICKFFTGSTVTEKLTGAIKGLFTKAFSGAEIGSGSGGVLSLLKNLALSEGGLMAGAVMGTVLLTHKIAGLVEAAQGGNGQLTEMGAALHAYVETMAASGTITQEQLEKLYLMIEEYESAGKTAQETTEAVSGALREYGVSSDAAALAIQNLNVQQSGTPEMLNMITEAARNLGAGFSESTIQVNNSMLSQQEAMNGIQQIFLSLITSCGEYSGSYQGLLNTLEMTGASTSTAQEAFDAVVTALENAGVPTKEFIELFKKKFPDAVVETKNSVEANMPETQRQITESIQTAEADVKESTKNMKEETDSNMSSMEKETKDKFGEVRDTSEEEWEESYNSVSEALSGMEGDTKTSMGNVMTTIQFYWSSVVKNTNQIWELMSRKVGAELGNMVDAADGAGRSIADRLDNGVSGAENAIVRTLNNIVSRVNHAINNINSAIGGVERAFTFSFDFYNPIAKKGYRGNYRLSLPRVGQVPYLAKGAVIPPKSEFLAVLGDQKHGTNVEAPLATIEQAVRSAMGSGNGGTVHVTAEVAGRTLLDIVIDEAELRMARNGKNPFALGGT